jgi:hypothetical protein
VPGIGEREVVFSTRDSVAGHVRLMHEGKFVFDRDLTIAVTPQQGMLGTQK